MNHLDQQKKEQLVIATGFVLILIVSVITLLRNDFNENDSKNTNSPKLGKQEPKTINYPTINTTDLQKKIATEKNKFTLLDIRPFDSYIDEHIVDSLQISLDEFPVGEKIDRHTHVIVIGQNSADADIEKAIEKLKKEDFKNITALAGGFEAWKEMLGTTVTYGNPNSFIDQSKVSYLDPEELNRALQSEAIVYIIDVRSNDEFQKGHIKGAINIPFDDLEKRRNEVTERKAVIVGSNELQEFQAAVQLYDMLLISPYVMRTAMPGWESKGYELEKN